MRVMWKTLGPDCSSSVEYGVLQEQLARGVAGRSEKRSVNAIRAGSGAAAAVQGASYNVTQAQMCSSPAIDFEMLLNLHTAVLNKLVRIPTGPCLRALRSTLLLLCQFGYPTCIHCWACAAAARLPDRRVPDINSCTGPGHVHAVI